MSPKELLTRLRIPFVEKGGRLSLRCPLHDDRTPSASFYLDSGRFYCFTENLSMDMVGFYARLREVSRKEAAETLGLEEKERPRLSSLLLEKTRRAAERSLEGKDWATKVQGWESLDRILWTYEREGKPNEWLFGEMRKWYGEGEEQLGELE